MMMKQYINGTPLAGVSSNHLATRSIIYRLHQKSTVELYQKKQNKY